MIEIHFHSKVLKPLIVEVGHSLILMVFCFVQVVSGGKTQSLRFLYTFPFFLTNGRIVKLYLLKCVKWLVVIPLSILFVGQDV